MSDTGKITILEYHQDSPNFHGNRLMVELKMIFLAAVGPMSFESIDESAESPLCPNSTFPSE